MKQLRYSLMAMVLVLAACAVKPDTPAQAVYDIQGKYVVALQVATAYKNLPTCEQPEPPLVCAKPQIVKELREADDVAYPALSAAQSVVRSPGLGLNMASYVKAADEAVKALTAITNKLKVR